MPSAPEVGAEDFRHDAGKLLVPVADLVWRVVAVVAAWHDVADARLLLAVVVVVGDEHGPKTIYTWLIFVAESSAISSRFVPSRSQRQTVPPGSRCRWWSTAALAVGALQVVDAQAAGIADAEIQLHVRADEDAVDAVVVIDAAEAGEQLFRRPSAFRRRSCP